MIYTSLDKLPMSRFIDMYNGDLTVLVKSGKSSIKELKEMSKKLKNEYVEIIGGTGVLSDIMQKNEMLELTMYIRILDIADELTGAGKWSVVCEILQDLGYSLSPDNHDAIRLKVKSILATKKFQYDKLKASIESDRKESKKDPDYFIKEMALVMTHFKMQIDKTKIMAKEYAYIVKRMSDEVTSSIRSMKRK